MCIGSNRAKLFFISMLIRLSIWFYTCTVVANFVAVLDLCLLCLLWLFVAFVAMVIKSATNPHLANSGHKIHHKVTILCPE